MQSEATIVVQAGLKVPVTTLAKALTITQLRIGTILAILYGAVWLHHWCIIGSRSTTRLGYAIRAVIGPLQLERQTLGNDIEFLIQHNIGIQCIGISGHITLTIIGSQTGCTSKRHVVAVIVIGTRQEILAVDNTRA